MILSEIQRLYPKLHEDLIELQKSGMIKLKVDKFVITNSFQRFKYNNLRVIQSKQCVNNNPEFFFQIFAGRLKYLTFKSLIDRLNKYNQGCVSSGKPALPDPSKKGGSASTFAGPGLTDEIGEIILGKDLRIHRIKLKSKESKFFLKSASSLFRKLSDKATAGDKLNYVYTDNFTVALGNDGYVEMFILCPLQLFTSRFDFDFHYLTDSEKFEFLKALNGDEIEIGIPILKGADKLSRAAVKLNRDNAISASFSGISSWVDQSTGSPEIDIRGDYYSSLNLAKLLIDPKRMTDLMLQIGAMHHEIMIKIKQIHAYMQFLK